MNSLADDSVLRYLAGLLERDVEVLIYVGTNDW